MPPITIITIIFEITVPNIFDSGCGKTVNFSPKYTNISHKVHVKHKQNTTKIIVFIEFSYVTIPSIMINIIFVIVSPIEAFPRLLSISNCKPQYTPPYHNYSRMYIFLLKNTSIKLFNNPTSSKSHH